VQHRVPTGVHRSRANASYLAAKADHGHHGLVVAPDPEGDDALPRRRHGA
jgi:hypothetical protein